MEFQYYIYIVIGVVTIALVAKGLVRAYKKSKINQTNQRLDNLMRQIKKD